MISVDKLKLKLHLVILAGMWMHHNYHYVIIGKAMACRVRHSITGVMDTVI